jgi:hypothetical protein
MVAGYYERGTARARVEEDALAAGFTAPGGAALVAASPGAPAALRCGAVVAGGIPPALCCAVVAGSVARRADGSHVGTAV